MQYTLLEAVQLILSSMDSDEVNSIDDSIESDQVALLLKSVFYDIASELDLPQQETLIELNASGDSTKPTLMTVPSGVTGIKWIKYDKQEAGDTYRNFELIHFLPFSEFIDMMTNERENTEVGSMSVTQNGDTFDILYRNDRAPTYYTTTNDSQIIFDSYDVSIDSTLQKSKTMCFGTRYPAWSMTNTFVPPLNPQQFSFFINKAKARAFNEIKQQVNQEAVSEARRQKIILQKKKGIVSTLPAIMRAPRYGRK